MINHCRNINTNQHDVFFPTMQRVFYKQDFQRLVFQTCTQPVPNTSFGRPASHDVSRTGYPIENGHFHRVPRGLPAFQEVQLLPDEKRYLLWDTLVVRLEPRIVADAFIEEATASSNKVAASSIWPVVSSGTISGSRRQRAGPKLCQSAIPHSSLLIDVRVRTSTETEQWWEVSSEREVTWTGQVIPRTLATSRMSGANLQVDN